MAYFLMTMLLLLGLFMMLIILLQRGRGGGLAGAFGGLGGQSAFGTKAGDVFTKITIVIATCWVVLSGVSSCVMSDLQYSKFEEGEKVGTSISAKDDEVKTDGGEKTKTKRKEDDLDKKTPKTSTDGETKPKKTPPVTTTDGDKKPADDTPATDGEKKPADDTPSATDGEKKPADDTPSTDSEKKPAEDTPVTDGEKKPADETPPATDGEKKPLPAEQPEEE